MLLNLFYFKNIKLFFLQTVTGIEEAVKKRKEDILKRQLSIQVLPVFEGP